jgi:hypothetical protein
VIEPTNNPVLWEKTGPKKGEPRKSAFNYLQDKELEWCSPNLERQNADERLKKQIAA